MNEHPADSVRIGPDDDLSAVDAQASAWLDEILSLPDREESLSPAPESLDAAAKSRLADLHFLHVLLTELNQSTSTVNLARVQQAMAAIRATPADLAAAAIAAAAPVQHEAVRPATPLADSLPRAGWWSGAAVDRRRWLISAAAAATVAGVALWMWTSGSSRVAHAAVQKIALNARTLSDRQYRVRSDLNFAHDEQGSVESTLYVRGGERYALRTGGAVGEVWMGSNGRQGWLIPVLGPPIITDNPSYPAQWAHDEGLALPDLQLTGLLDLMAQRFRLSLHASEALPDRPGILCQRISGRCQTRDGGPQRIELWAHPTTGVAQRLVLEWARSPDEDGLTRIQLDLLAEEPQPDSWYEAEGHRRTRPFPLRIPILPSAPS